MPKLLLFSYRNVGIGLAINLEFIAKEIVRPLVGSLGLFFCCPNHNLTGCIKCCKI